ncbi:MAG: inorganic phosphate transporter [archaeon]
MAVVIGANSSGNCIATAIASKVLPRKKGLAITAIFVVLGLYLEGSKLDKAVAGGILSGTSAPEIVILVTLAGAFVATALATYFGMPVSTSQCLAVSFGLASFYMGEALNLIYIKWMVFAWFATPVMAGFLSLIFYYAYFKFAKRVDSHHVTGTLPILMLTMTSIFAAYTLGANTGGFLVSIAGASGNQSVLLVSLLPIAIAIYFLSWPVIRTIGVGISELGIVTATVSQLAAAIVMYVFTQYHIPTSLSLAIVGGVGGIGIGYGPGFKTLRRFGKIAAWWLVTPAVSGIISVMILYLL